MTRRENFAATLAHRTPDALVLDLGGCPLSSMEGRSQQRLLDFLGYAPDPDTPPGRIDERVLRDLDIDTRAVGGFPVPKSRLAKRNSDVSFTDEWGVERVFTGQYWDIVRFPLAGATLEDLERYPWPDPESVDLRTVEAMRDEAKRLLETTDYVLCASHPVLGIFELGCWMCGFDDFLIRMAIEPEFVHRFFEIILAYQKKMIRLYYGLLGPYIHYTSSGDDFATQTSSFVSPGMFDELIKPYFAERIRYTKTFTDAAYLHHSCGDVHRLIPSLIDCGVEILNPIQPVGGEMAPERLKASFGDRVCFHGGIDTQSLLPFGTPGQVGAEVERVARVLAKDGGYFLAAAHNIQEDVPPENVVALFQTARKWRN